MFGKVQEDSFQNIFDFSLDYSSQNDDHNSRCLIAGSTNQKYRHNLHGDSEGRLLTANAKNLNTFNFGSSGKDTLAPCLSLLSSTLGAHSPSSSSSSSSPGSLHVDPWTNSSDDNNLLPSSTLDHRYDHHPTLGSILASTKTTTNQQLSPDDGWSIFSNDPPFNSNAKKNQSLFEQFHSDTSSTSSSCSSSSSPSSTSSKINTSRYKTEMCRPFQENGACKYGDKCQFAHGQHELKSVLRHPKYKTDLCRTYHKSGFCPYGPRCHFIHNFDEANNASQQQQKKQQTQQQLLRPSAPTSPNSLSGGPSPAEKNGIRPLPMFPSQSFVQEGKEKYVDSTSGSVSPHATYDLELQLNSVSSNLQNSLLVDDDGSDENSLTSNPWKEQYTTIRKQRLPVFSTLFQ